MKWTTTIIKIGKQAIEPQNEMVILFGEHIAADLVDVAVIQKFVGQTPVSSFVFKKGDTITIDGQTYVADYVGPMVENNMKALGHATLFFKRHPAQHPLANAIYFELAVGQTMPTFQVDDDLVYEHL